MPIVTMDAPRTVAMNSGNRLWINSEDASMNSEPSPNAQMPAGSPRNAGDGLHARGGLPEGGSFT
jgi:hypothetical protein